MGVDVEMRVRKAQKWAEENQIRCPFVEPKLDAPSSPPVPYIFLSSCCKTLRHFIRSRADGSGKVNEEREQTLKQMLVEIDGFDATGGVIMIAATNRPDILDPALLRPGRFDRQIAVERPDLNGREAVLEVPVSVSGFTIARQVLDLVRQAEASNRVERVAYELRGKLGGTGLGGTGFGTSGEIDLTGLAR